MKFAIFIPVRLSSTRLPGKALAEVKGRPVLAHLIERLKLSKVTDTIVICTTKDTTDDPLENLASQCGVNLYRGSRDDLIQRMSNAATEHGVEYLICVDGDDVMMDPEQVDQVAQFIDDRNADFVRMAGMPFGTNPIALKATALQRVCAIKESTDTATGWGVYFEESNEFIVESLDVQSADLNQPELRLTLDYPEDLAMISAIYEQLYMDSHSIRIRDVIKLLDENPALTQLNAGLEEKYWKHVQENQTGA